MVESALILKQALNGLSVILFLTMLGLGLAIIFGMMRVINMAHADLFMLGAYVVVVTMSLGLPFWIGLAVAPLLVGLLGVAMERSIVRLLYGREDLSTLLATWGFSIILQQVIQLLFGASQQRVQSPIAGSAEFLGITYPLYHLVAMAISLALIALVVLLFGRTPFGVMARATMQNATMAGALGINTSVMFMVSFALGAALAGAAGALLAPLFAITPTMGLDFLGRAFFVVIVGGMNSIAGTLGGGAIIGGTESVFSGALSGTAAQIIVLLLVIGIMLLRPRGVFQK